MSNFGPLGVVPSVEDIQERINDSFDELFHYDSKGNRHAFVCTFCDEFLISKRNQHFVPVETVKKNHHLFRWDEHIQDPLELSALEPLVTAYTFNDRDNRVRGQWMKGLCLSPRGVIGRTKNLKFGFSSCTKCKNWIAAKKLPFYAIVNRNFVGYAPECLKELTEVELAFISPVKGYGYCFRWVGGAQKCLKGSMTFMRIEERSIVKATVQLDCMGLKKHIAVILSGKMTKEQKLRTRQCIRVDKVITAVKWLCCNHRRWKSIDYSKYERELENFVPEIIDHSEEVASENQNIEKEELFSCYYPDGAVNESHGGFNDPADFKGFIDEMHRRGFNIELQVQLAKNFVNGSDGDQLISSSLLQFPYGIGGLEEERRLPDGSFTEKSHLEPFMTHLSLLSQPVFQYPMFQLILYSLTSKLRLLRKSRFQVRDERTASAIANGLDLSALRNSIRGRQSGNRFAGTVASRAILSSVESMSRALPHSNEAAKNARSTGESMQHVLGIPSLFLTVTFDDENSLLMQVLSCESIDDVRAVNTLSDAELAERAIQRKELRLRYPGLGALNFEMLLEIVVQQVIGWDMHNHCATDLPGLFGACEALAAAMEEQGRLTVHVHFSLWIKGFDSLRKSLFFGTQAEQRSASKLIPDYCEHVSTTELIGYARKRDLNIAFDHEKCSVGIDERPNLSIIPDQGLRNLRHRLGYKEDSTFASCARCTQCYTYEDLVGLYCERIGTIHDPTPSTCTADKSQSESQILIPKCRMHALCVEFQKLRGATVDDTPILAINACYNSHASSHVTGCFKCQKNGKKTKHACGANRDCECRFRMPDRARRQACVRDVKEDNPWFEWNGNEKKQPIIEILPKRHTYDLFQNVSCKAISESKLTCNSNISVITDGPVGQYQFKYIMKSTQEDDTAAYSEVEKSIKGVQSRVHQDDAKEATRLICRAAFAHNKNNVIGPSFASYLTRHDSRFYFSHDFQYCPLKDLKKALKNEKLSSIVMYSASGDDHYLSNYALHYLCRPSALESLSPRQFFEDYYVLEVGTKKRKRTGPGTVDMRFIADTTFFKHPSVIKTGPNAGICRQGVELRNDSLNIQISQWTFPDTARFKANLLTCNDSELNCAMEEYAEYMLLLFLNYRSAKDLEPRNRCSSFPFVRKLREISATDHLLERAGLPKQVFNDRNLNFLQNIQNCAHNSLRYKLLTDDLQSVTECFKPSGAHTCDNEDCDQDEEEEEELPYELFLTHVDTTGYDDQDPTLFFEKLCDYSFKGIRNRGVHGCGRDSSVPTIDVNEFLRDSNAEWVFSTPINRATGNTRNSGQSYPDVPEWKVRDIVNVLLRRSVAKARPKVFKGNQEAKVCDANGTAESIREWAAAAKLDPRQKRAFEAITASFLLTFHEFEQDDFNDATLDVYTVKRAQDEKDLLLVLKGGSGRQLVFLLHGPGGSGKSTVINLVMAYCREFCEILGHPFTIRTIVVSALSGVAATLIHGETTHSGMGLNLSKINSDMIEAWADTRLVIIDECSFGSEELFTKIEQRGRELKQNAFSFFGGLNVVYAGDFSQLEPPRANAIYNVPDCPAFQGLMNAFIELDGRHRFKNDPEYGEMMLRFRNGTPTVDDIRLINQNCVISATHAPGSNVPVAVYRNRNRDAINCAMFEEYCEKNEPANQNEVFRGALLVFMDQLEMRDGRKTYVPVMSNQVKDYFYRNCGEDACNTGDKKGRVDPVLKLYPECPMMLTENKDVSNGQANGSRAFLKSVAIKAGERPMIVQMASGTKIRGYFVSQVQSITLRHEMSDITPQEFQVVPESFSFRARVNVDDEILNVQMKGTQFPIISNGVTTGHKLQGCSLDELAVFEHFYGQNWMYVILSRVRTMKGLYLARPLSEDLSKYAMADAMKEMIRSFQEKVGLKLD